MNQERGGRRDFLRGAGALALTLGLGGCWSRTQRPAAPEPAAPAAGPAPARQPNVIFVFADQLRAGALSCYDPAQPATPNLDRLAGEGVRFTNALSTWPVCSPYRAMLLTGRYPMSNGVVGNQLALREGQATLGKAFKTAGYDTAYIGKWHLEEHLRPFIPPRRRQGFDFWASRNCSHEYFNSFYCGDTPAPVALPGYEPDAQTDLAIDYIRRHRERPFCLVLSWGPPHDPYVAPEALMRQFDPQDLALPANAAERAMVDAMLADDPDPLPLEFAARRAAGRRRLDSDDGVRRMMQGYYAALRALDSDLGRLTAALAEAGLADDTILAFSSDHGDMLGAHRMGSKQMPFEESIQIPFLLRYPRAVPAGQVSAGLLRPIDVMPTLLELAGVSVPYSVEGLSHAGAVRGARTHSPEAALIMKMLPGGNPWIENGARPWRGVRTARYTYARTMLDGRRTTAGPWLLFDNQEDPGQVHNLVHDPGRRKLREALDEQMRELMREAHDPGDPALIQHQAAAPAPSGAAPG